MNKQQERQDAAPRHDGPQAPGSAVNGDFGLAKSNIERLLIYLCRAVDTHMVKRKVQAVVELRHSFTLVARQARDELPQPGFCKLLSLYARAATNVSALMLQDTQGTQGLQLFGGAGEVVCVLFSCVVQMISTSVTQDNLAGADTYKLVLSEIDSSGLLPVLQPFTQAVHASLQHLTAAAPQAQQQHTRKAKQQQQQLVAAWEQHIERCRFAAGLVDNLLCFWGCLLHPMLCISTANKALIAAAPAAIGLAGSAWSSLGRILDNCVKNSMNTLSAASRTAIKDALDSIPERSLEVAVSVVMVLRRAADCSGPPQPQSIECYIPSIDQLRAVLLADKLPELLLQLLAYLVSKLHAANHGQSATLRECSVLAAATADDVGRQREQHEQSLDPNSFIAPAHHTGLAHALGQGGVEIASQLYPNTSDQTVTTDFVATTVTALRGTLLQRCTAAQYNSSSESGSSSSNSNSSGSGNSSSGSSSRGSSSSSSNSVHAPTQQGQEQTGQQQPCVLQQHLVAPAVKVLIELLLLLQPQDIALQAQVAQLIMLLLHAGYAQPAAAPAAAGPWPELPAAVAAGLLQPVVSQLARAVIYCLLQTQPKQQQQQHCQQQQQQQTAPTEPLLQQSNQQQLLDQDGQQQQQQQQQQGQGSSDLETDRLTLLHYYGSLLITVCQSVEPKHIAAALLQSRNRADTMVSLTALEAVLRAQACHLVPAAWKQQQRQQVMGASLNHISKVRRSLLGLVCQPLDQVPLLLLPFVTGSIRAVMFVEQQLLDDRKNPINNFVASLSIFKLTLTALKVSQLAAAAAGQQSTLAASSGALRVSTPDSAAAAAAFAASDVEGAQAVVCQCADVVTVVIDIAGLWCSSVHGSEDISEGTRGVMSSVGMLPLVMLARAAQCFGDQYQKLRDPFNFVTCETGTVAARHPLTVALSNVCDLITDRALAALKAAAATAAATAAACAGSQQSHEQQQQPGGWPGAERVEELKQNVVTLQQLVQQIRSVGAPTADGRLCTAATATTACYTAPASTSATVVGVQVHAPTAPPGDQGLQTPNSQAVSKMFQEWVQHLQQFSPAVLAEFPVQYCCNNPACLNLSKLSEYQLVCGKGCICAGCEVARYCSRECQRQHWQQHKPVCRRLRISSCSA